MKWNETSRRSFLSTTGLGAAAVASGCARRELAATPARPNILVILVDDLGFGDLGCFGAPDLDTPNLDRLAQEGVRFTNAYANCPVCSPTRAALLSGRFPDLVGVPGVIRTHESDSWGYLLPSATLLPRVMQSQGYTTALIGKWHLGLEAPNRPNERGFDFFHGFLGDMMDDYWDHRRFGNNYMRINERVIDPEGHATDLFSDWACDYLRQPHREKPFFLYLAYNAPHTPIHPPQEWVDAYMQKHPDADPRRAKLAAFIEHMDDGIGRVLSTLDETGQRENTLVVFTSDNGGQMNVGANNGATRAGKGTLYEGGIRVPMMARLPGVIPAGSRTDRIALSMDILPSVMEGAGLQIHHAIEGISVWPSMCGKNQTPETRDLFFTRREGGRVFKGGRIEALRRGDWKILRPTPGAPVEVYNLADDPLEEMDLATTNLTKTTELREALDAQMAMYDTIPWQKPKG